MLQQKGSGVRNINRMDFKEMDRLVKEGKLVFELND
jgi:hypothetical protein